MYVKRGIMAHDKCVKKCKDCDCIKDDLQELCKRRKTKKAWAIVNSYGVISKNGGMFEIFDTQKLAETHIAMGVGYLKCKVVSIEIL